ncbi:MAG: CDP-2,3-bis-(O-geranylgeranyl)-sn-glycerol synthase [Thermoplasmatota archaeon]
MGAEAILQALWLFLPAYVANMSPVFSAKLVPKWSHPIDGGRSRPDGTRYLGDGKTWRGLAGGALAAGLAALGMTYITPHWNLVSAFDFDVDNVGRLRVFLFGAVVGFMALAGDAVESYFKRKSGRERGAPWIPFDQLDFVVFGLLGMLLAGAWVGYDWLLEALLGDWLILTTLIVLTPALHLLINRIGYWMGLKEVPW